ADEGFSQPDLQPHRPDGEGYRLVGPAGPGGLRGDGRDRVRQGRRRRPVGERRPRRRRLRCSHAAGSPFCRWVTKRLQQGGECFETPVRLGWRRKPEEVAPDRGWISTALL